MLDKAVKNVDCFISPSRFTIKKHHESGLKIPFIYMPYFLPLSEERSYENEMEDEEKPYEPYFLFVGRLEKIKGLQNLIPVFKDYLRSKIVDSRRWGIRKIFMENGKRKHKCKIFRQG